jgi:hypothetical protein
MLIEKGHLSGESEPLYLLYKWQSRGKARLGKKVLMRRRETGLKPSEKRFDKKTAGEDKKSICGPK